MAPESVSRYVVTQQWIGYDAAALLDLLIQAKTAAGILNRMPYLPQWIEQVHEEQLRLEAAGTSRIEGAEFTQREQEEALAAGGRNLQRSGIHAPILRCKTGVAIPFSRCRRRTRMLNAPCTRYNDWMAHLPDQSPADEMAQHLADMAEMHADQVERHLPDPGRRWAEAVLLVLPGQRDRAGRPTWCMSRMTAWTASTEAYRRHVAGRVGSSAPRTPGGCNPVTSKTLSTDLAQVAVVTTLWYHQLSSSAMAPRSELERA